MTGQSRDNGDQRPPRALVCVLTFENVIYFDRFDRDGGIGSQMYITSRFWRGGGGGGQRKLGLDQRGRIGVILNYFLIFFVC